MRVQSSPRDRKAPNGTGSVFWSESNGCWFASYTRGLTADGRPITKRFRAATEEAARRKRDEDRRRWETLPPPPAQIGPDGRAFVRLASAPFRRWIHQRDGGVCGICRQPVSLAEMHVDHVRPRIEGGNDAVDNLRASHPACNLRRRRERAQPIWV